MKDFVYQGKELFEFWKITGEVLDCKKYNETHISSSGGGGNINQIGGYISGHIDPQRIDSSTVTNLEIWIKTEDGSEKDIRLNGIDIPLRPGQKVTLISAGVKGAGQGLYSILVNHSAGKHWFITDALNLLDHLRKHWLTTGFGRLKQLFSMVVWMAFISLGIRFCSLMTESYISTSITFAIFCLITVFIYYKTMRNTMQFILYTRGRDCVKKLTIHLDNLAQLAYKSS